MDAERVSMQQECLVYYRTVGIPDSYPLNAHGAPPIMVRAKVKRPTIFRMSSR